MAITMGGSDLEMQESAYGSQFGIIPAEQQSGGCESSLEDITILFGAAGVPESEIYSARYIPTVLSTLSGVVGFVFIAMKAEIPGQTL